MDASSIELEMLPWEVVELILSRLPLQSVASLRLVNSNTLHLMNNFWNIYPPYKKHRRERKVWLRRSHDLLHFRVGHDICVRRLGLQPHLFTAVVSINSSPTGLVDQLAHGALCRSLELRGDHFQPATSYGGYQLDAIRFPCELLAIAHLQVLQITACHIDRIPEEIGTLANLQRLVLCNSTINDPLDPLTLVRLTALVLRQTTLSLAHHNIAALTNLVELTITSWGSARSTLDGLPQLTKLHKLTFSQNGNRPLNLPPALGQLTRLQHLDLSSNGLTALPLSFIHLTRLHSLILRCNSFSDPQALAPLTALRQLEHVSLYQNFLAEAPSSLCALPQLRTIDLGRNRLRGPLPDSLMALRQLRHVSVIYNPQLEIREAAEGLRAKGVLVSAGDSGCNIPL